MQLLALVALQAICSLAGPAIDVALRAPFTPAPYLLELMLVAPHPVI